MRLQIIINVLLSGLRYSFNQQKSLVSFCKILEIIKKNQKRELISLNLNTKSRIKIFLLTYIQVTDIINDRCKINLIIFSSHIRSISLLSYETHISSFENFLLNRQIKLMKKAFTFYVDKHQSLFDFFTTVKLSGTSKVTYTNQKTL